MKLTELNRIYKNCDGVHVKNHRVRHGKLQLLGRSITRLRKALSENENELFWRRPLRILRYYQFNSIWAPVPLNDPLLIDSGQMGVLNEALGKVVETYPSQSKFFKECCDLLQGLYDGSENPLYDCMKDLLSNNTGPVGPLIVLLHKPRAQETVSEVLNFSMDQGEIPHTEFNVLTPPALKNFPAAKTMLLFGPVSLYAKRSYVFSSPKVDYFHTINYAWFNDRVTIENDFNSSLGGPPKIENDGHAMYGKEIETSVIEKEKTAFKYEMARGGKNYKKGTDDRADAIVIARAGEFLLRNKDNEGFLSEKIILVD